MKASKINLAIVTAILIAVAAVLVIIPKDADVGKGPDAPGYSTPDDTDSPDVPQYADEAVVSDSALPSAKPPVLRIGAKEDPDVYLQSLDIQVEVTGNIASTRYTMIFKNNTDRLLEGELTFPLPDGRTATHYALDINGKMRDAVPVEKARATQVFEEIQQREVDPGVLERVEGNNYRTRIYPFPRRGTRTISIGYEEELSLENGLLYYRLPMAYPNALEKFGVTATVWNTSRKPLVPQSENELRFDRADENYVASFAGENYRPSRALIFALPAPVNIPQVVMQSAQGSHYFLASVAPKSETRKKRWSDELAIIWDVSLSGSQRNLEHELKMLDVIFADKKNANVHLYFLNNKLKKIVDKNSANGEYKVVDGNWDGLKKVLETAVFDGGTDFSQINLKDIKGDEILFFSDGISTLSDADFLKNVKPKNIIRPIHSIVSSPSADYSAMKLIAGRTKGKFININALSYEKLKDELLNETLQFLGVEHGKNVREVHPSIAAPVQGNFSITGISSGNNAELTLLFGFGGKVEKRMAVKLDAGRAGQGKVHRIWAQKKIEELDLDFNKNRAELTGLGKQFGIVTRNTSLIVLETIDDYVRFSIEPPATEPKMRAEYHNWRKGRDREMQDTERSMLADAVTAAHNIIKWWDIEFKLPDELKYPVPDDELYAGVGTDGASGKKMSDKKSRSGGLFSRGETKSDIRDSSLSVRSANLVKSEVTESRGSQTERAISDDDEGWNHGDRKMMRPSSGNAGGGDPRARVTSQGGRVVAASDIFGEGGFAADIDAILSGGGLKSGGDGGIGRKGAAGIGYGSGYGSGFGGGSGGIDELMGGLMGSDDGELSLKKRGELKTPSTDFFMGRSVTGGRSRASVLRVVLQNMAAMRHAYNKRLRDKPYLCGTITVRFAIDEFGKITFVRMVSSTMDDSELENAVVERVRNYVFEKIDKPGDVTEVTYPFVFSQYGDCDPNEDNHRKKVERWIKEEERREKESERQRKAEEERLKKAEEERLRQLAEFAGAHLKNLTGNLADDYQEYLKLRNSHLNSPKFYFDMAAWFYKHDDRETALRILTSIAELELENAPLYRMLGYRFKEYGEYALQKFVCKKVVEWRPMEPQSYRDYALALADNGETQAALDSLHGLLTKSYSANIGNRSRGIEEVVITEMNRLIAKNPRLSVSKIDRRLRSNMPVDVRMVLNWNLNNTNVDLSVIDPTGEESSHHRSYSRSSDRTISGCNCNVCRSSRSGGYEATTIGGRLSPDNSSGYGPEQFMLKKAAKGKYRVYATYKSSREFAASGPVTVMAEVYTKYGRKDEQRKVITLQLTRERGAWNSWGRWQGGSGDRVLVGEFDF